MMLRPPIQSSFNPDAPVFNSPWNAISLSHTSQSTKLSPITKLEHLVASDVLHSPKSCYSGTTAVPSPVIPAQVVNAGCCCQVETVKQHMSHTSSRTWLSAKSKEHDKWLLTRDTLKRHYKPGAQVPWTFDEWLRHREATTTAETRKLATYLANHDEKIRLDRLGIPALKVAFGGKVFRGNRSAVLAQKTMWCHDWYVPERWCAEVWPGLEEREWEGVQRAGSGFGRFLPIPRDYPVDDLMINWKTAGNLPIFDLDQVRLPPTAEDIFAPVDEVPDNLIQDFMNKEVLEALDNNDSL